jgi:hypothetical protein
MQFLQHRPRDRVERLWPVERNQKPAALLLVKDFFVVRHHNSIDSLFEPFQQFNPLERSGDFSVLNGFALR